MTETPSLRDRILKEAGELFRQQGYAATPIKQIATAAGCTTAALYYYFEDGKQHILREVIHQSAQEVEFPPDLPQADSLEEFLLLLGADLTERFPQVAERFNWILLQFAALPDEEKSILQDQAMSVQAALQERIGRYVADEGQAGRLAWLVYCAFFGYQQMFTKMELGRIVDLSPEAYGRLLAGLVEQGL